MEIDFESELNNLLYCVGELYHFVENYVTIPQMHWAHTQWFNHYYYQQCPIAHNHIIDFLDDLDEDDTMVDHDRLFDIISEYNTIFQRLRDRTSEARIKPWHFREYEILQGSDNYEDDEEYERAIRYIYTFKGLDSFPRKYKYTGD
jgi:hypothetical protein